MKTTVVNKRYEDVIALPKEKRFKPMKQSMFFRVLLKVASFFDLAAARFKCNKIGREQLKSDEPCLVLMNHSSFIDLEIVASVLFPRKFNIVATNDVNFCKGYKLFESPYRVKDENPSAIKGLNIVVTGTLANFSRGGIENQIRKLGGNPQSSVTKKTDLVVVADYKPGTKKIADAKKYGIKMISEQEFFEMIGE